MHCGGKIIAYGAPIADHRRAVGLLRIVIRIIFGKRRSNVQNTGEASKERW